MKMDPEFIEQAQRRLDLLLRDCRQYMRKFCDWKWKRGCHQYPCEAVGFGEGIEKCEQRLNELKYLGTLLAGSGTRKKPGKKQYWSRLPRARTPRVKVYPP